MATLFETTAINGMQMRNRLVRSATWEGMCADDGCFKPGLEEGGIYCIVAKKEVHKEARAREEGA